MAVQNSGARRGLPPDPLAIHCDEATVDPREKPGVAPSAELTKHGAFGRQVFRDKPPRDAATQYLEDGIDDLTHRPNWLATSARGWRKQRRERLPFAVRQIGFISGLVATILPPGGRVHMTLPFWL